LNEISSSNIPIDRIIVGKGRYREDLGDIPIANEISKIGLLQPIVVNVDHKLICGLRRIEAFKVLGKSEIPACIVNLEVIVKGEISENTLRKDFSWAEIIENKKAVELEIRKESETRMLSGKPSAYFARAKVAKYVSLHGKEISHSNLASAEKVYDAVQKEPNTFGQIWRDLNSEKISPHKALKKA